MWRKLSILLAILWLTFAWPLLGQLHFQCHTHERTNPGAVRVYEYSSDVVVDFVTESRDRVFVLAISRTSRNLLFTMITLLAIVITLLAIVIVVRALKNFWRNLFYPESARLESTRSLSGRHKIAMVSAFLWLLFVYYGAYECLRHSAYQSDNPVYVNEDSGKFPCQCPQFQIRAYSQSIELEALVFGRHIVVNPPFWFAMSSIGVLTAISVLVVAPSVAKTWRHFFQHKHSQGYPAAVETILQTCPLGGPRPTIVLEYALPDRSGARINWIAAAFAFLIWAVTAWIIIVKLGYVFD